MFTSIIFWVICGIEVGVLFFAILKIIEHFKAYPSSNIIDHLEEGSSEKTNSKHTEIIPPFLGEDDFGEIFVVYRLPTRSNVKDLTKKTIDKYRSVLERLAKK